MELDVTRLEKALKEDLPGWPAQQLMSPVADPRYRQLTHDYKRAAVMALLYPDPSRGYQVILIERARHNTNDKHAGQIGFPGGKYEEEDRDMLTCALREVREEIGLPPDAIQVLGPLSELFVFASNFLVQPYVGVCEEPPTYTIQESEVHSVLEVPIAVLMDDNNHRYKDLTIGNHTIHQVPYYDIQGHMLWGATAMMTSELLQTIKKTSSYSQ